MDVLSSRLFLLPLALVGFWALYRRMRAAHSSRFDRSAEARYERFMLWPYYVAIAGFGIITLTQLILATTQVPQSSKRTILNIGAGLGLALVAIGGAAAIIVPFAIGFITGSNDSRDTH